MVSHPELGSDPPIGSDREPLGVTQSVFKSISMEKDTPLWKKRKTESKIHWPLRDFRKSWTSSVSFGTPSRVSQIT